MMANSKKALHLLRTQGFTHFNVVSENNTVVCSMQ
jgi:hypothetical protein